VTQLEQQPKKMEDDLKEKMEDDLKRNENGRQTQIF
jgi:hypothetical protein